MTEKILNLIREKRKYAVLTLDGYKPINHQMCRILDDEIELEMKIIGAKNKTKMRKEAKGNLYLEAKLKNKEC